LDQKKYKWTLALPCSSRVTQSMPAALARDGSRSAASSSGTKTRRPARRRRSLGDGFSAIIASCTPVGRSHINGAVKASLPPPAGRHHDI